MKKTLLTLVALCMATFSFAVDRITVAEFLQKADTETVYELAGTVKTIKNTKYGNFYLEQDGSEIYIYGLVTAEDPAKQNLITELGIKEGDNIVVQGAYTEYNGNPEIVNAIYVSHESVGEAVDISNTVETAYTTTQAFELIAAGKGLSTKVYVKGEVLPDDLNVDTDYGNATFTISDGTSNLVIFRCYYFNGEKFTSEDQIQDGDEVVVYGQLVDYNGTYEMTTGGQVVVLNGQTGPTIDPYTLVGEGTEEKPYTIADVKNLYADSENTPKEEVWVKGTILGNVNTSTGATIVPNVFTDVSGDGIVDKNDCGEGEIAAVATNLSLGEGEANIAVQLPNNEVRTALNILDNQTLIGATVAVCGKIQKYCGVAGIKETSAYKIYGADGIENVTVAENANVYNLAGQRVAENYRGVVIKAGKKYLNK